MQREEIDGFFKDLPIRVTKGCFDKECLVLEFGGDNSRKENLKWEDIFKVNLGLIEENLMSSNPPMAPFRKMLRKSMFGEDDKHSEVKSFRRSIIIDIFLKNPQTRYRLDAGHINYKSFLNEVEYVSHLNLAKFLEELFKFLPPEKFNNCALNYSAKKMNAVKKHTNIYDYEFECKREFVKEYFPEEIEKFTEHQIYMGEDVLYDGEYDMEEDPRDNQYDE